MTAPAAEDATEDESDNNQKSEEDRAAGNYSFTSNRGESKKVYAANRPKVQDIVSNYVNQNQRIDYA